MKHRDKRAALIAKIFHPCIALQPTCKDSHRHDESTHIANTNAFATPSLPAQLLQAVCIHPHPLNSVIIRCEAYISRHSSDKSCDKSGSDNR